MEECFFCNDESITTIPSQYTHLILGGHSKDDIPVCGEHNRKCWNEINKSEFSATMLSLVVMGVSIIAIIIFIIMSVYYLFF